MDKNDKIYNFPDRFLILTTNLTKKHLENIYRQYQEENWTILPSTKFYDQWLLNSNYARRLTIDDICINGEDKSE